MPRGLNAGSFTPSMRATMGAVMRKAWGIEKDQRPGPVRMRFNPTHSHKWVLEQTGPNVWRCQVCWIAVTSRNKPPARNPTHGADCNCATCNPSNTEYGWIGIRRYALSYSPPGEDMAVSLGLGVAPARVGWHLWVAPDGKHPMVSKWFADKASAIEYIRKDAVGNPKGTKGPASGFRCMECGAAIPKGRKRCPKCGSYDVDLANPGARYHQDMQKWAFHQATRSGLPKSERRYYEGQEVAHSVSESRSRGLGMSNPARSKLMPLLLIGGIGLIIWLANRKS